MKTLHRNLLIAQEAALAFLIGGRAHNSGGTVRGGKDASAWNCRHRRRGARRPRGLPRHRRFAARVRRGSRTVRAALAILADRRAPHNLESQGGPMMKTLATVGWTGFSLALTFLVFSQACVDDELTSPPGARKVTAPTSQEELGESQLVLDLAREIPGFGGLYYEPGGERLVIAMTEANRAGFPAARQEVFASLAADVSPPSMANVAAVDFVERVVEYSFVELARHRARLRPGLFAIPEVVGLHVDEEFNRIGIGLEDVSARAAVLDLAMELSFPVEMLSFSEESPIRQLRISSGKRYTPSSSRPTLQDLITIPDARLRGGYGVKALGGGYCTLGFTAMRTERPATTVFVSNSHCSRIPYRTAGPYV